MSESKDQPRKLTRRQLGEIGAAGILALRETLKIVPHLLPPASDTVFRKVNEAWRDYHETQERVAIGTEIRQWTLPTGIRVASLSPELDLAGQIYQSGLVAPYLPQAQEKFRVLHKEEKAAGAFEVERRYDLESQARIIAQSPEVTPFEIPFIATMRASIVLSPRLRGSRARNVVAAKEVNQLADYVAYAKAYAALLKQQGAVFEIKNAGSRRISEELVAVSIAMAQQDIENARGRRPWFNLFVDEGSFFRAGSIAFANWFIHYTHEEPLLPESYTKSGHSAAGFLQQEGWLEIRFSGQQPSHAVWKRGRAPGISNGEVYNLMQRF